MWALIDSYFHIACHRVYISHQDILECQDQFGNVQSRRLQYGKPSGRLEVQSVHLSLELPFTRQGHLEGALEPALLATFLHLCPVEGKEGWWLEGSIPQCTLAPCHSFGPVNLSESWGWGTLPPCLWVDSETPPPLPFLDEIISDSLPLSPWGERLTFNFILHISFPQVWVC